VFGKNQSICLVFGENQNSSVVFGKNQSISGVFGKNQNVPLQMLSTRGILGRKFDILVVTCLWRIFQAFSLI
jgi:hypothetical protein